MMNQSTARGLERLGAATVVLNRRLTYLEGHIRTIGEHRTTAHYRTVEEMATLRWLIALLNRNVNRSLLEHARMVPMPLEVTDDDPPRLMYLEPEADV